jgi:hypothetical protein
MFDQEEQDFSQIVETGLELILSGKATLEQVLARYPDRAQAMRPELEAAIWLASRSQEVTPRPGFVTASRRRVVDRIKQEASSQGAKHGFMGIAWPKRLSFQWVAVALLLIVLFTGTGGVVTFAQDTIPGENLYAVKRISETVIYSVAMNDSSRAELSASFAKRRLTEATGLLQQGAIDAVAPVLEEYQRQMNRTIELIQNVSQVNETQAAELAQDLKPQLVEQAAIMEEMHAAAPPAVLGYIESAQAAVADTITSTDDLSDGVFDLDTATPTVTPTFTVTGAAPSAIPAASETPVPPDFTATPLPSDPMDDEYPLFRDVVTAVDEEGNPASATPVPAVKGTKTPRPTNVNKDVRPGQTDNPSQNKPPKDDKSDSNTGKDK